MIGRSRLAVLAGVVLGVAGHALALGPEDMSTAIRAALVRSGGHYVAAIVQTEGPLLCKGTDGPDQGPQTKECVRRARITEVIDQSSLDGDRQPTELWWQTYSPTGELSQTVGSNLVFSIPGDWCDQMIIVIPATATNIDAMRLSIRLALGRPVEI